MPLHTVTPTRDSDAVNGVRTVAPYLPQSLVPATALAKIYALVEKLPFLPFAGFECRLDADDQVDYFANISRFEGSIPAEFFPQANWHLLQNIYRPWLNDKTGIGRDMNELGLEIDVVSAFEELPAPGIFIAINPALANPCPVLFGTLDLLFNSDAADLKENIRKCVNALPQGGTVSHIGALLSRKSHGIRLNIAGLGFDRVRDYLAAIGWNEPTEELEFLLNRYSTCVDHFVLCIDLMGKAVGPRVGFECYIHTPHANGPQWERLMQQLVRDDLSTPEKKTGFLSWPGITEYRFHTDTWPKSQRNISGLLGNYGLDVCNRTLNHVKLSIVPGKGIQAKGYFLYQYRWI
ncbi:hypothetical protein GWR56_11035 [Mucilaginibacter sp. 14171R-50]|uniref:hypothetical protein n=1 Tax=Mucilaginibacter sp. 14171R-50 TaxID=2703789 RepID=UPI00138D85A8|nr:hypothetical protein [Mucilaginibacter sp. 14171R-50]QHS56043.1 hypothetical protein GWR56_11035 [Mucilaginibacter sp. 14171R-50]